MEVESMGELVMSFALLLAPYQPSTIGQCKIDRDCNQYFTSPNWHCLENKCSIQEGESDEQE